MKESWSGQLIRLVFWIFGVFLEKNMRRLKLNIIFAEGSAGIHLFMRRKKDKDTAEIK